MNAKLVNKDGIVKISVNGEVLDAVGYMTYNPDGGQFPKFTAIGNRIVFFGAYATDRGLNGLAGSRPFSPPFYLAGNTFDFTEIDRILELIAPGGVGPYIIPRVYFAASSWWERENPEECCRLHTGESAKECYASEKWRSDMWSAVKALIDHINGSVWKELVIGYHVAAGSTEEWGYGGHQMKTSYIDYSECSKRKLRLWLREKYGTISELNAAWGRNLTCFEQVKTPSPFELEFARNGILRDLPREQNLVDYAEYINWLTMDTILWFCGKIKAYTDRKLLAGSFYGYIVCHIDALSGHFCVSQLVSSPDIDFIATTNDLSDTRGFYTAVDTIRLHGKLFISEGDIRTCLTREPGATLPQFVPNNSYYSRGTWVGPDYRESIASLKRGSARALTGHTGLWWFDMWGGWFDDPEMMEVIRHHTRLQEAQTLGPIRPQVALILDEAGLRYFKYKASSLRMAVHQLCRQLHLCGAPFHMYTARDLCHPDFPVDAYKLYIFAGGCRVEDAVAEAVNTRLKGGGRTLLWTYFDGHNDPSLTDFTLFYQSALPNIRAAFSNGDFPTFTSAFTLAKSNGPLLWPEKPVTCPRFSPDENPDACMMAPIEGTAEPAVMFWQFDHYTSICSIVPGLPHQVLRQVAAMSGVHLFTQTGDVLFAGGRYVGLYSTFAGEKRIHFPFPVKAVYDAYTGEKMDLNEIFTDFTMEAHETRLFRFET